MILNKSECGVTFRQATAGLFPMDSVYKLLLPSRQRFYGSARVFSQYPLG